MSSHAPYGEPRAKSTRFLPPDPGVELGPVLKALHKWGETYGQP